MLAIPDKLAAFFLRHLSKTNPLDPDVYEAVAKLTTSIAIEAVAFRRSEDTGKIEVFMTQRPPTDKAFANMWHCPGSVVRPRESYDQVFDRLEKGEFQCALGERKPIGELFVENERGWFLCKIFLVYLPSNPPVGQWYAVDALPVATVISHKKEIIPFALTYFV